MHERFQLPRMDRIIALNVAMGAIWMSPKRGEPFPQSRPSDAWSAPSGDPQSSSFTFDEMLNLLSLHIIMNAVLSESPTADAQGIIPESEGSAK